VHPLHVPSEHAPERPRPTWPARLGLRPTGRHRRIIPLASRAGFLRLARITVALIAATALTAGSTLVATQAGAVPRATAAVSAHPTLKYNSSGAAVKWLQTALGVRPRSGWFGPKTRSAVKRYQKRHGLRATGVVTGPTWRKLGVAYQRPARKVASRSAARTPVPATTAANAKVTRVAAQTARGARYRYGATGPKSFDCSGYVGYVVRQATGKKLPRTASAMRKATKRISRSQARPGDLVFVHRGGRVSHVSIYAGAGAWWEASNPRTGVGLHRAWTSSVSYGRI
jgi:cell wall-associated NlpC family hydrolase